jgi:peptidoglycan/xylan/chitin deacetylase (PgdA/CDA1 family)
MNIPKFAFGHRGAANLVRRSAQIATRFGPNPERMGARLERLVDILDEFSVRPTLPITALPMSRNPKFARRLLERGAELAVHGWSHIDLSTLDLAGQRAHMGRAVDLFRACSVPFTGFRAPYLRWNEDTMRVVAEFQFSYSSNRTVPATRFRSLPYLRDGFVEIPVSLPEDEIPLEDMHIRDPSFLGGMWRRILTLTHERGELFTLQLHPERIDVFAGTLRGLLADARARAPAVWIATLDEIAQWWKGKAQNRAQFIREGERFRVEIEACPGTTVFIRENGAERAVAPGPLVVESSFRPSVGVSAGSNRDAVGFLADLGYFVEVGDRSGGYSVHLGLLDSADYTSIEACRRVIEESKRPLVRQGTWPGGARSAFAVTGDIDALTIWDFVHRFRGL